MKGKHEVSWKKNHNKKIKKSKRSSFCKVTNVLLYLLKICDKTSTTSKLTDWQIQGSDKRNTEKEELKLQILLNFCSKSKNRQEKLSRKLWQEKDVNLNNKTLLALQFFCFLRVSLNTFRKAFGKFWQSRFW